MIQIKHSFRKAQKIVGNAGPKALEKGWGEVSHIEISHRRK